MVLVVFLHLLHYGGVGGMFTEQITLLFGSFRMPAFFFISGFLLSQYRNDVSEFFIHRSKQIVLPYVVFFIINYLVWIFFTRHYIQWDLKLFDPLYGLLKGAATLRSENNAPFMITANSLWFVTTLFVAQMYFFIVKKFVKRDLYILGILFLFSLIGFFSNYILRPYHIWPYWNANVAFTAAVFFGLGYLVKKNNIIHHLHKVDARQRFFLMISMMAISISLSLINPVVIAANQFGNPIIFYPAAISGIFGFTLLFMQFEFLGNNGLLKYIGRNTFVILGFDMLIIYLTKIMMVDFIGIPEEIYSHSVIWTILFVSITIIGMVLVIELFNRYMSFILNQKT